MKKAKLIGLTGNIATGKSEVTRVLRELGVIVIDADQVAREVVQRGTPALAQIVREFGVSVLTPDGELDRKAMGRIVFNDAVQLRKLEAIVHPAARDELLRQIAAVPRDRMCVIEVIKLFENHWAEKCDQVWVTHCAPEVQIARLMQSRGMSEADARARVSAQNSQAEKLKRADVVIDTSGTLAHTREQVLRAFAALS